MEISLSLVLDASGTAVFALSGALLAVRAPGLGADCV